ncbi:TlpA family protein disulfide reductase [Maribacter algarum]|uniref:TlpA family protein disulfide reductase n=1 Tax=Maribacter algarum (ex Zhang et al. 2020) TaxID=2578118 RepID=A0A5S3PRC9_9FLAO|nr:TlpA disulfide reductase family protein [Maribacter algarum]TMM57272.1 TlpA family protein disulfide reductase [Maribacter algarum]
MRFRFTVLTLCFLLCNACGETPKAPEQKEAQATTVPEVQEVKSTYESLDGQPIELSDYKGKRILLNYWATWCKPCIEEMPSMVEAQTLLENENYIFLLASDQSMKKIKAFQKKKSFDLNFVKYNGSLASEEITALPATFIYNVEGEKVERIDGATEWNSPEIIQKLKNIQ